MPTASLSKTAPFPATAHGLAASLCLAMVALGACGGGEDTPRAGAPTTERERLASHFGFLPPAPPPRVEPNEAMVALGEKLYHDERLSRDGDLSCASCHALDAFGQDSLPTSPGSGGAAGKRNTPSSFNAFLHHVQFWDGRAPSVEEQATGPMLATAEHGLDSEAQLESLLAGIDGYPELFAAAFPDDDEPITAANFENAIGAFERTLRTISRFDHWLDGDDEALSAGELAGLETFVEVGCTNCHNGRLVGGGQFRKLGEVIPLDPPPSDRGRGELVPNMDHVFKVPSLLNVAETGPYLHDGSIASLPDVVTLMGKHQLGVDLTDEQVASIVTFLKSLTGELANGR